MFMPCDDRGNRLGRPWRRDSGISLAEALVAASLALLLLSVIVKLLVPSLNASRKTTTRMDLHQKALLMNHYLEEDFKRTARSGFSFDAGTGLLSIHRRSVATASIVWEPLVLAYVHGSSKLERWEVPLESSPSNPTTLALPLPAGARLRQSVQDVISFQVEKKEGPAVSFILDFEKGRERLTWRRDLFLPTSSH